MERTNAWHKRIKENLCQITGADKEFSPERPVLSVPEVYRLADAIEPRYRALVLLATFGNMRWTGLRRRYLDRDLDGRSLRVVETVYEFGQLVKGTPQVRGEQAEDHPARADRARAATAPGHVLGARTRWFRIRRHQGRAVAA